MTKKKKHILSFVDEIDFEMIGICSHHSDYRLVWGINDKIKLKLVKSDNDFCNTNRKGETISEHSMYSFVDEENRLEYYFIKNKVQGKFLIPEKAEMDYFLFLCNNTSVELDALLKGLKEVVSILAAYEFDPTEIPSTENIVFN